MIAITHDRKIVRNRHNGLIAFLDIFLLAIFPDMFYITAEFDLGRILRTADLKWIAIL